MTSSESQNKPAHEFFYMTVPDYSFGECSDDSCPCGLQGVKIRRNQGYLYVSEEVVKMRQDCSSWQEFVEKATRIGEEMQRRSKFNVTANLGKLGSPMLICERGARKRKLDLAVAAEDAKQWWQSGKVPLRPTPKKLKAAKKNRLKGISSTFNCSCYKCDHSWQCDSQKLQTDGGAKCPSCGLWLPVTDDALDRVGFVAAIDKAGSGQILSGKDFVNAVQSIDKDNKTTINNRRKEKKWWQFW